MREYRMSGRMEGCEEERGEWVKKVAVKGSVNPRNTAQFSCK
jgi:hypothetical protein